MELLQPLVVGRHGKILDSLSKVLIIFVTIDVLFRRALFFFFLEFIVV